MFKASRLVVPLAADLLLVGCATTDPYSGQTQRSSTATGTGIGAAVGAAAGALSGSGSTSRRDRALIGAAVGAAAGAGIGAYMDRQEQELRESMRGTGVDVERRGDDIVLNMPGSVTFGFDSSELTVQARNALNDVANILTQYTDTRVNIVGHTDSTGSVSYNQQLSERRAEAVGNYLAQSDVMRNRLYMTGSGPHQPVASNATEEGRAQNRRVEITLSPIQEQFQ